MIQARKATFRLHGYLVGSSRHILHRNFTILDNSSMPITVKNKDNARRIADLVDDFIEQYCSLSGEPLKTAMNAVKIEPDCTIAHCAVGLFGCISFALPYSHPFISGSLKAAVSICHTDIASERDKVFTEVLHYWSRGKWYIGLGALEQWLSRNPTDIFAIKLCQDGYYFCGDSLNIKGVISRVLPFWRRYNHGYGYLLGMYSFGLEECGRYEDAIENAQQALNYNKDDVWAMHALAHVYEMMGRSNEGQSMLRNKSDRWENANLLRCHLSWHLALFYLDHGHFNAVKRLYDVDMAKAKMGEQWSSDLLKDVTPFSLTDMTSLLWRLELFGGDAEERWTEVAKAWKLFDKLNISTFNDIHAVMAFAAMYSRTSDDIWLSDAMAVVDRMKETHQVSDERLDFERSSENNLCRKFPFKYCSRNYSDANEIDNVSVAQKVGVPLCEGIIAYSGQDFETTCEKILSIDSLHSLAGSHSQKDVVALTLLEASMRLEDQHLAKMLTAERISDRSQSAQAWMRYGAVLERLGDIEGANNAAYTAYQLGLGQRPSF